MMDALFSFGEWLETTRLTEWLSSWPHTLPLMSSLHYFSVFLLMGMIVIFHLRVLGLAGRRQSITQVAEELFPWMWTGFGLAMLSGFLMFTPGAGEFFKTSFFLPKLFTILLGFVAVLLIRRNVRKWDQAPVPPTGAKLAALISLLIWITALFTAVEVGQYACQ